MVLLLGASNSKKRRAGAEEDETASAEEDDSISALPEDLCLRILSLLPLKSAIRWPAPSSLDFHLLPDDGPEQILESLERRGRRRLDRFSLTIHPHDYRSPNRRRNLKVEDLRGYLDYAAACDVEDLHIGIDDFIVSTFCVLYFPPGCSHLAQLSLRRVNRVSFGFSRRDNVFSALEVVHLRSVRSVDLDNLLSSWPRLRTLDLRYCERVRGAIYVMRGGAAHLRSLTVAECNNVNEIDAVLRTSGLRSFGLSSASLPTYNIPATAPLDDLYISLPGSNLRNPVRYCSRALPDLANLTALTICSSDC